jgi:hypothetical protein
MFYNDEDLAVEHFEDGDTTISSGSSKITVCSGWPIAP